MGRYFHQASLWTLNGPPRNVLSLAPSKGSFCVSYRQLQDWQSGRRSRVVPLSISFDALSDPLSLKPYDCAETNGFTREAQDSFAIASTTRAQQAQGPGTPEAAEHSGVPQRIGRLRHQ